MVYARGLRSLWFLLLVMIFAGCSDDGIDGTGGKPQQVVEGTAAMGSPITDRIHLKDRDGKRLTADPDVNGKFKFVVTDLNPPFLLSVKVKQGPRLFSIATSHGVTNIHPYADFISRNWFSSRLRDIEAEFDDDQPGSSHPTIQEVDELIGALRNLIAGFLDDFGVKASFDLIRSPFNADHTGFDRLLDHSGFKIVNNRITVTITEPDTVKSFVALIVFKLDLAEDITQTDIQPPTEPSGVVAIPASSDSVAVLWNSATDNIGVSGYNIYRADNAQGNNLQQIATSPYPSYIDTGLTANTNYWYAVEAVDGAGNTSTKTDLVVAMTPAVPDITAPALPTDLVITEISNTTFALTWMPTQENDVLGYNVWRRLDSVADFTKVATTVASSYDDTGLLPATRYCYKLQSFDAKLNTTDIAKITESCYTTPNNPVTDTQTPVSIATPAGGIYNSVQQNIVLSCIDDNGACTVHYSLNGSDPTTDSPVYLQPLTIAVNSTLKFFAIDSAGNVEDWNAEVYEIDLAAPVSSANPAGGTYSSVQQVTLSCGDGEGSGCDKIYYTLGTTPPTASSSVYSQPLTIETNTTVNFFAVDNAGNPETPFHSEDYNFSVDIAGPTTSATPVGGTYASSQSVTLSCNDNGGSGCATIYYTTNGDDPTNASTAYDINNPTPIDINTTTLLKFYGVDNVGNPEEQINQEDYTITGPMLLDVSVASNQVISGGRVFYMMTVSNVSAQTMTGVSLFYTVPTGITFNSSNDADPNASAGCGACSVGNEALWNLGTLVSGETKTVVINAIVAGGLVNGTQINAPIRVAATELTADINFVKTVEVYNSPMAQLALDASADPVVPGESFLYKMNVGNFSNAELTGVQLRVSLPAGLTIDNANGGNPDATSGDIVWNLPNILPGQSLERELNVTLDGAALAGDILVARAKLLHDGGLVTGIGAEFPITVTGSVLPLLVDVSVSQNPVATGDRLLYTMTVNNDSVQAIDGVSLLTRLPAGISYNSASDADPNADTGCGGCVAGNESQWNLGRLEAGESRTIMINAEVNAAGTLLNGSLISVPIRVMATGLADTMILRKTVKVQANPSAHLVLGASTDAVVEGETFTYHVDVGNISGANLAGVVLRARLPSGVTVDNASLIAGGGAMDSVSGELVWTIGALNATASLHREVKVSVNAGMAGEILAARLNLIHSANPEIDVSAEHTVTVTGSALPLLVDVSVSQNPVATGDRLLYTMTVNNDSVQAIDGVSLLTRLPVGISYNSASDADPNASTGCGGCVAGNESQWNLGRLEAGESRTIMINAEVNAAGTLLNGSLISVPIRVMATGLADTMVLRKTVKVQANPSAHLVLGASTDAVVEGETFTYQVDVGNISGANLAGVVLRARLPSGVTVDNASLIAGGGAIDSVSGELVWTIGALDATTSLHREVKVSVDAGMAGEILAARLSLIHNASPEIDVSAEHTVTVTGSALPLLVDVSVSQNPVATGDRLLYTMTVNNDSVQAIDGVSLLTRLPAGISYNSASDADPNASTGCGGCVAGDESQWTVGRLEPGESRTIMINAEIDVAGTLVDGSLISVPIRIMATGLADTMVLRKTVKKYGNTIAQLSMTTAVDAVTPVQSFPFMIDAGNSTTTNLTGVELRTRLPAGVTVDGASLSPDGELDAVSGEIVWTIGGLDAATSLHREVSVTVDAGTEGTILTASTQLTHANGLEVDLSTEHTVTVVAAALPLTVAVTSEPSPVIVGNQLYTITLDNSTGQDINGVSVLFRVPAGISYNSANDATPNATTGCGGCVAGDESQWSLSVAANTVESISISATVDSLLPTGFLIPAPIRVSATGLTDTVIIVNTVAVQ